MVVLVLYSVIVDVRPRTPLVTPQVTPSTILWSTTKEFPDLCQRVPGRRGVDHRRLSSHLCRDVSVSTHLCVPSRSVVSVVRLCRACR